jgi:hypothetical protein
LFHGPVHAGHDVGVLCDFLESHVAFKDEKHSSFCLVLSTKRRGVHDLHADGIEQ